MISRPRLSPTLDRFLGTRFLEPFAISLAAFTGIYLLGDLFDRFDDLVRYKGFGVLGLEYFLLKVPLMASQLMPVACLAGVLLALALLNRSGEVLACQGLGVSRLEMATPVLLLAAILSLVNFGLSETIVPFATRQARHLYTVDLKKREMRGVFANRRIWMRVRDGFLSADSFDAKRIELRGLTVYQMDAAYGLRDVRHAQKAIWNGASWQIDDPTIFKLLDNGTVIPAPSEAFGIDAKPADFSIVAQDPEEFSLAELNRYIHDLRSKGLDPGGYIVDRDLKYAMPVACFIMVALGVALSLDPKPRSLSLSRSFGLGIAIGFGYWLILGFSSSFGRSGVMPPWLAAWLPNLAFGATAASIFMFGEEY